jgi:dTDP-L-rhamnose 4-epimerase
MVVYGDGAYACPEHGALDRADRTTEQLAQGGWEPRCPRCGTDAEPRAITEEQPLRPSSTYGISKRDQEELCLVLGRTYRIPTIALRYLCTYGSRQVLGNPYTGVAAIWATRLLNGKAPVVFEDGGQLRDFLHVSDAVAANLAAADAPAAADYQAFNIGSGEHHSILELARLLGQALGRPIEPQVTGEFREGDIRHCFADVSRARRLLDWSPKVGLATGIAELARWAERESPTDTTDRANAELRAAGIIH